MSSWVTDEKGRWHPAKEIANLTNNSNKNIVIEITDDKGAKFKKTIAPGMPYVYEGPCRAALLDAWEQLGKPSEEEMKKRLENKDLTIGEDFRRNNEFLESYAKAKNALGFKDVEEYLAYVGYDEKKVRADFESKASVIKLHELPQRIEEIKRIGGGDNKANPGKDIRYGGFGEPAELRA
jgi:hypothetical protein